MTRFSDVATRHQTMDALHSSSATNYSRWRSPCASIVQFLFQLVAVCLLISVVSAGGGGMCEGGCQNGGKMLMPNNVFGYCRCRCPPDYKGPKCQFVDKRGSSPPDVEDWNVSGGGLQASRLGRLEPAGSVDIVEGDEVDVETADQVLEALADRSKDDNNRYIIVTSRK